MTRHGRRAWRPTSSATPWRCSAAAPWPAPAMSSGPGRSPSRTSTRPQSLWTPPCDAGGRQVVIVDGGGIDVLIDNDECLTTAPLTTQCSTRDRRHARPRQDAAHGVAVTPSAHRLLLLSALDPTGRPDVSPNYALHVLSDRPLPPVGERAQLHLFVFLGAVACGTIIGRFRPRPLRSQVRHLGVDPRRATVHPRAPVRRPLLDDGAQRHRSASQVASAVLGHRRLRAGARSRRRSA